MSTWSNLSQNLNQESGVAGLATIVAGLAETYTAEELNLASTFTNSQTWTSIPSYQKNWPKDYRSFSTYWNAGIDWDVKTSFAWGLHEGEMDGEVHSLILNPYVDVYGYFTSYFDFFFPYGMIGFTFFVEPT